MRAQIGSRVRRLVWAAAAATTFAAAAVAVPAAAQPESVSVGGFDRAGLDVVVLASFDAAGSPTWWSAADSRWGAAGTLVEGDVELAEGSDVVRVMVPKADGSLFRLNDGGPLVLREFFGAGGAGADLTVWVQTAAGTASFPASGVHSAGGGYVNFAVPVSGRAVVGGVGAGDRFVLALTRPGPGSAPVPDTETGTTQPEAAVPDDAVTGLVVASGAAGELTAAWDAPAEVPVDYRVSWRKAGESWPSWRDDDGNAYPTATTLTVTGLDEGAAYEVHVRARFGGRSGPWSAAASAVTAAAGDGADEQDEDEAPEGPVAVPSGLSATAVDGSVVLSWDDPADPRITGYEIRVGRHPTLMTDLHGDTGSPAAAYVHDDAQAGVPGYYAVRAIHPGGHTDASALASVTPPAPPEDLDATFGDASVELSWAAPAAASWDHLFGHQVGTDPTGYAVLRGLTPQTLEVVASDVAGAATAYSDGYAVGDGTVYYALRTLSAHGSGALSRVLRVGAEPQLPVVDQTRTLVANTGARDAPTPTVIVDSNGVGQPFTTGGSRHGYVLNEVRLRIRPASAVAQVAVSVHADAAGAWGARLHSLSPPKNLDADVDVFTAPGGAELEADTTYWIVVRATAGTAVMEVAEGSRADGSSMSGFALSGHHTAQNGENGSADGRGPSRRGLGNRQSPNAVRSELRGRNARDLPADNTTTATLTVGRKVTGTVDFVGDRDFYRVQLDAANAYRIRVKPTEWGQDEMGDLVEPNIRVYQAVRDFENAEQDIARVSYKGICTRDGWGRSENDAFFHGPTAGEYLVEVSSRAGRGTTYTIAVDEADPEGDTAFAARHAGVILVPGGSYSGRLHVPHDYDGDTDHDTPEDDNDLDHDWDLVVLEGLQAGMRYTVTVRGLPIIADLQITGLYDSVSNAGSGTSVAGFGTVRDNEPGYLLDGDGNSVRFEHDGNGRVRVRFTAARSGDHYVRIEARDETETHTGTRGKRDPCVYRSDGVDYTVNLWEDPDGQTLDVSPVATAVDGGTDSGGTDTYDRLRLPYGVAAFTNAGSHYAIVGSSDDDGFQIIDITDPSAPTAESDGTDDADGFTALDGVRFIAVHTIGASRYALITARDENAVQIVDITDPSSPTAAAALFDGQGGFDRLRTPQGVATHIIGRRHYALVAAQRDDALQIIDITNPTAPTHVSAPRDGQNGFEELAGPYGVAVHTIGGRHYALVASSQDSGVQIVDITNPANPTPVSHMSDGQGGFDRLSAAVGIATVTIGGRHYALVAAATDNAVTVVDITDPANPTPVSHMSDGQGGFDRLRFPAAITAVTIRHRHYALVAAASEDAVTVVDITDPTDPQLVESLVDGQNGYTALFSPYDVAVHEIGGRYYGLAAARDDNGVQIFELEVGLPSVGHSLIQSRPADLYNSDSWDFATGFTAGKSHSGAPWYPKSVTLQIFRQLSSVAPRPVVSLHLDDGNGRPGWKVATLIPPADLTEAILAGSRADFTFRVPDRAYNFPDHANESETWLWAGQKYWIVIERNDTMFVGQALPGHSTGVPYHTAGWNIDRTLLWRSPTGWRVSDAPSTGPAHFEIHGYLRD